MAGITEVLIFGSKCLSSKSLDVKNLPKMTHVLSH